MIDTGSFLIEEKTFKIQCKSCNCSWFIPDREMFKTWVGTGKPNDLETIRKHKLMSAAVTQEIKNHIKICSKRNLLLQSLKETHEKRRPAQRLG